MSRSPSPVDLYDFPYLELTPTVYAKAEAPPPCIEEDLLDGDQVIHLKCSVWTIDISGINDVFPKLFRLDHDTTASVMADTGANSCIADSERHQFDCRNIKPVRIGLSLKSSGPATHYTCSRMGYLPMTREDGLMHHQPFLVNEHASDTSMSLEAIMQLCPDFASYRQEGFKDGSPGVLEFYGASRCPLLRLSLHKKSGLYYCSINIIATDTLTVRPQISQCFINSHTNTGSDDLPMNSTPPV